MRKLLLATALFTAVTLSADAQLTITPAVGSSGGVTSGTATTPDATADNVIAATAADKTPLVLQLAPSQTANAFEVQASDGTNALHITASGSLTTVGYIEVQGALYAGTDVSEGIRLGTTWIRALGDGAIMLRNNAQTNSAVIAVGSGSPEGVLAAGPGSSYHRVDGGAGTSFYVKESGTGNTGWVAK